MQSTPPALSGQYIAMRSEVDLSTPTARLTPLLSDRSSPSIGARRRDPPGDDARGKPPVAPGIGVWAMFSKADRGATGALVRGES